MKIDVHYNNKKNKDKKNSNKYIRNPLSYSNPTPKTALQDVKKKHQDYFFVRATR